MENEDNTTEKPSERPKVTRKRLPEDKIERKRNVKTWRDYMKQMAEANRDIPTVEDSWWASEAKVNTVGLANGKTSKFANPETLWEAAREYFIWAVNTPIKSEEISMYRGEIIRTHVNKKRAVTLQGLLLYINMNATTWNNYKYKKGFTEVIELIENYIYVDKYEHAAAGLLNASMVMRDIGLRDGRDVHTKVHGEVSINTNGAQFMEVIDPSNYTTQELVELERLLTKPKALQEQNADSEPIEAEIIE